MGKFTVNPNQFDGNRNMVSGGFRLRSYLKPISSESKIDHDMIIIHSSSIHNPFISNKKSISPWHTGINDHERLILPSCNHHFSWCLYHETCWFSPRTGWDKDFATSDWESATGGFRNRRLNQGVTFSPNLLHGLFVWEMWCNMGLDGIWYASIVGMYCRGWNWQFMHGKWDWNNNNLFILDMRGK